MDYLMLIFYETNFQFTHYPFHHNSSAHANQQRAAKEIDVAHLEG